MPSLWGLSIKTRTSCTLPALIQLSHIPHMFFCCYCFLIMRVCDVCLCIHAFVCMCVHVYGGSALM